MINSALSMQDECEEVGVSLQDILDVNVVAACGPPGGGRNPISPRLLKNFWSVVHAGSDSVWFSYKRLCSETEVPGCLYLRHGNC